MILQLQRKDGRSTETRVTHGAKRARAKRCAHLQQCACPLDGVPAATGSHAGAPMLSVRPVSTESLCVQRESKSGGRYSVSEEADLVCVAAKT